MATKTVRNKKRPAPAARLQRGVCRKCGCTDWAACPEGCAWVDKAHTKCSGCYGT